MAWSQIGPSGVGDLSAVVSARALAVFPAWKTRVPSRLKTAMTSQLVASPAAFQDQRSSRRRRSSSAAAEPIYGVLSSGPTRSTTFGGFVLRAIHVNPVRTRHADMARQMTSARLCALDASATGATPLRARFASSINPDVAPNAAGDARRASP